MRGITLTVPDQPGRALPSKSTVVNTTTAHNGSLVRYQNGSDDRVAAKNSQSVLVIMSDCFKAAKMAIRMLIAPDTPIAHTPNYP